MPTQTRLPHHVPTAVDPAYVLPTSRLLSALQRQWDGLHVAYAHFPPGEWPLPPISGHLITLHLGQPVNTVRQRDGRTCRGMKVHGDIEIVPAGSPSFWAYASANEALGMMLDPAFVQQVALQAGQIAPDRLELPHNFGVRDPLIEHLGLALLADLRATEVGSRLFAESAAQVLAVHLLRHYMLVYLVQHRDRLVSKAELFEHIWPRCTWRTALLRAVFGPSDKPWAIAGRCKG